MIKGSQIALRSVHPERSALARGELLLGGRAGLPMRLALIWRATVDLIAPWGYEDESGFHYGELPHQTVRTENS